MKAVDRTGVVLDELTVFGFHLVLEMCEQNLSNFFKPFL